MKNNIVFVLGMHRSGTSMLTSMVEASGYHCGDNLQPPGSDNPNGYWEDLVMLRINETLLRALGKDWSSLGTPEYSEIEELSCFDELKTEAVGYLTQQINKYQRLVVKDPRVCILLPFWLSVCKELNATSKFLIIKRDAAAIVQSLHKRDLMDPVYAMQLIICYWVQVAVHLVGSELNWQLVNYESIGEVKAHQSLAKKLATFIDVKPDNILVALASYNSELNHAKNNEVVLQPIVFDFQSGFYQAFPCEISDSAYLQHKALSFVHSSLSFWGDTKAIIQKVAQSLDVFSKNLGHEKLVLYGAGTVAKTILTHMFPKVMCGVDQSFTAIKDLHGVSFYPVSQLGNLEETTILVTVTGRKAEIQSRLSTYGHNVIFIEDYFNDQTNY
ncbi:hypothetical protein [uncultured Paraglaciecola sp.]|uniref:sulfotransferase family protein n=1 Tax=uncultured Paraglaciecola sp. TaxID=1765024 RepID=UPI00259A661D|nr:hypothetical protein [uncultured Paraglaciecola sp.]